MNELFFIENGQAVSFQDIKPEDLEKMSLQTLRDLEPYKNAYIEKTIEECVVSIKNAPNSNKAFRFYSIINDLVIAYTGDKKEYFISLQMVLMHHIHMMQKGESSEKNIHDWFKKNVSILGENAYVVDHEHPIGKYRADFLCKVHGKEIIVEIKKDQVDKKALRQIEKYLKISGVRMGILIGSELKVKLPENIMFISYKDWKCV